MFWTKKVHTYQESLMPEVIYHQDNVGFSYSDYSDIPLDKPVTILFHGSADEFDDESLISLLDKVYEMGRNSVAVAKKDLTSDKNEL